ncbi:MAG: hypothetical protein A3J63_04030 [Candidatus Moranbacteria bacterium RIFCSPHIGHO2_02_FULL_40_12b]|nr:MAG: hypothetical protein A3J63_04030 [Candidatus Moranbacteria bacterium RIFCSPHIGHO2_02_FULL_40_12b]
MKIFCPSRTKRIYSAKRNKEIGFWIRVRKGNFADFFISENFEKYDKNAKIKSSPAGCPHAAPSS